MRAGPLVRVVTSFVAVRPGALALTLFVAFVVLVDMVASGLFTMDLDRPQIAFTNAHFNPK